MRRFSNIDNVFALKYKLTLQEAFVTEWMINLPNWAETLLIDGKPYFFASKKQSG